jgi:stage IV sporulation protein FB
MVRFAFFGIPVVIHPWFWITLAIIGFPTSSKGAMPEGLLYLLLFILAGFISILVHEMGHAIAARKFGAQTAVSLHAFGGYASYPAGRFTRLQEFFVAAAGPFVQFVLGGIFLVIFLKIRGTVSPFAEDFIGDLAMISIFWAILNLIPVLPMDGGMMMSSILGPSRLELSLKISMTVAILGAVALIAFRITPLFPIFLGMFAFLNWQQLKHLRRK